MVDDKEFLDRIDRFQSLSISFIVSNDEPVKRKIPAHIKEKVKGAAGEQCPICKTTMISSPPPKQTPLDARESTPDHIVDLDLGGKNTEENFLIICHKCNWAKNHAKQRYLNTPGIQGGTPGHPEWRAAFRSKGSNIAKLLEYVEWSFRIEEPSSDHRFPELHGYFMQDRFGKSEEPESKIENTMWKRFTRFISRPFSRKPKTTPKKTIEESKTRSSKRKTRRSKPIKSVEKLELDFAPEDFAAGLLSQKKREQPVTFTTLYERLIKENPKFELKQYGIKPNDYLTEQCSDLLKIIENPDGKTPPTIHYWITEKNPQEGFPESSVSRGIKGFSTANKSLSFPRDPVHLAILVRLFARPNPDSLSYRDLLGISRSEFGKTTPNGADVRIWSYLQHLRGQGPEEVVHESYSNSSPEEIITELHQYFVEVLYLEIHPDDRDIELVDDYFQSIGSEYYDLKKASKASMLEISKTLHERNTQQLMADKTNTQRSKADKTNTNVIETSAHQGFRKIIIGIVHRTPHSKISISALGQRFSKIVQKMGFANKSEYFDSIGLPKNKSISKSIEEHFPDGEIAIDGKHVIRNRRD